MKTEPSIKFFDEMINEMLEENSLRLKKYTYEHNPASGYGCYGNRTELKLDDHPTPLQFIPSQMLENFILDLKEAGTIEKFIASHEWMDTPSTHDVVEMIAHIREKYDFQYWAFRNIMLENKALNQLTPFKLNYSQLILLQKCEELRENNKPINIIVCHPEGDDVSVFSIFYQLWIALKWNPEHHFTICAATNEVAQKLLNMLRTALGFYDARALRGEGKLTLSLIPGTNEYIIKDTITGKRVCNNSILVGSAQSSDYLRGLSIEGNVLQNLAIWPDTKESPAEDLVKAISGGVLSKPYTMQVYESVPKEGDNYFSRKWIEANSGNSGFLPIFLPWFYDKEKKAPITLEREFAEWLWMRSHLEKDKQAQYLWHLWELGATLQNIRYYMSQRVDFKEHSLMLSDFPADELTVFPSNNKA